MKYEIYINSDDYWLFDHGTAHLDDGKEIELKAWLRTATYGRDGVLIDDKEHFDLCRFPLRWLIDKDGLSFYSVDVDGPDEVLFHNTSDRAVRIDDYGILEPGESLEINLLEE